MSHAIEAVLLSADMSEPGNVVATLALGYESAYSLGIRTPIPDRILLDERVFELAETEDDENGRVAYYGELADDEGNEAS